MFDDLFIYVVVEVSFAPQRTQRNVYASVDYDICKMWAENESERELPIYNYRYVPLDEQIAVLEEHKTEHYWIQKIKSF